MLAILKRELKGYFCNMTGCIFTALLLCFAGIFATVVNLYGQSAMFEYTLSNVSMILLVIIPILAMRSVSEDKHNKTDQLLYALPIKTSGIVLAKYFALLGIFLLSIIVMVIYPFILSAFGIINYSSCFAALLGFFLLGAALLSISMFISSLTESQLIAAVISFAVLLLMYMMNIFAALIPSSAIASFIGLLLVIVALAFLLYLYTRNYLVSTIAAFVLMVPMSLFYYFKRTLFEGLIPRILSSLAVFDRFNNFIYGIFDLRAVIYYLSITVFFVFLTVQSFEKKRWS